jgi:hypothetical protein
MKITRRTLQVGLGLLWLLDAALQFQPYMFSTSFGRTELAAAGSGQPWIVSQPVHLTAQFVIAHPVLTNTGFAIVQLALAVGLLWKRTARGALIASIAWAVSVWWLGEGLGGLTSGGTLLTGAPGAALLYAVIALFAFPDREGSSASRPSGWAIPTWAGLWLTGAGLQLAAGNNSGAAFGMMFHDARADNGGWIANIDAHLDRIHFANSVVAVVIAVQLAIALWALVPGRARELSVAVGVVVSVAAWGLVQGFGDLFSGQSTDPNSGPLIVLLGLAVIGARFAMTKVPTPLRPVREPQTSQMP